MPYLVDQTINTGLYIETTTILDVSELQEINVNSEEFRRLLTRLYEKFNNVILALNVKDSGYYILQEFVTSQLYYNPASNSPLEFRPAFRKTFNIGALGGGVTTIAHGMAITSSWKFVHIYGAATNSGTLDQYPLPFAGAAGNNIELRLNGANIVINNASGVVFTSATVIVEFLKY